MKTVWILRDWIDYEGGSLLCVWEEKPDVDILSKLFKKRVRKLNRREIYVLLEVGEFKESGEIVKFILEEIELGKYLGY